MHTHANSSTLMRTHAHSNASFLNCITSFGSVPHPSDPRAMATSDPSEQLPPGAGVVAAGSNIVVAAGVHEQVNGADSVD